jgi:hypothetical protein
MGFHAFNKEITTPCLNPLISWFRFSVGAAGAVTADTTYQLKGNFIESVTYSATGIYTVQLTRPYPEAIINARATVNRAGATDADVRMDYDAGTYSKTAGTLVFFTSGHTAAGNTTQVAADPPTNSEVHVELVFAGRKHAAAYD